MNSNLNGCRFTVTNLLTGTEHVAENDFYPLTLAGEYLEALEDYIDLKCDENELSKVLDMFVILTAPVTTLGLLITDWSMDIIDHEYVPEAVMEPIVPIRVKIFNSENAVIYEVESEMARPDDIGFDSDDIPDGEQSVALKIHDFLGEGTFDGWKETEKMLARNGYDSLYRRMDKNTMEVMFDLGMAFGGRILALVAGRIG